VFKTEWRSECDVRKQRFIAQQFDTPILAEDTAQVAKSTATDIQSGQAKVVPHVNMILAGFPCKDQSPLNKNSKHHRSCIASATGVTGLGFKSSMDAMRCHSPELVLLENLT
jgi:site-specific DNA-cytosine methylase